jgi:osmotically-inducible protein OsmY
VIALVTFATGWLATGWLATACERHQERVGRTEITSGTMDMPGPTTSEDKEQLRRAEAAATRDLGITVDLQRALDDDEALSRKAKSVTILTIDRRVTLRGQVANAEEAAVVVDKARNVPGVVAVEDLLEYPPSEE